jgi:hypothetical protein
MARGDWSGGFVDSENLEVMKDWARGMCRGVDPSQTAKCLNSMTPMEERASGYRLVRALWELG